jgi:hypothetical protein
MLKVLASVLAILSAAISITLYSTTIPAVQKQAEDNAAAIETLGGSVSDNAAAIETLGGSVSDNAAAIETLEGKHLYEHTITFYSGPAYSKIFNCTFTVITNYNTVLNTYSLILNNLKPSTSDQKNYIIYGDKRENNAISEVYYQLRLSSYGSSIYGYKLDGSSATQTIDSSINYSDSVRTIL